MLYLDFEVTPQHCTSDTIVNLEVQIRSKGSRYVTSQSATIEEKQREQDFLDRMATILFAKENSPNQ